MSDSDKQVNKLTATFTSSEIGLLGYWHLFLGAWVQIIGVLVVSVSAATAYLYVTPPTYEVDVLVQIEQDGSMFGEMDKLTALFGGDSSKINGEIELLRSRSILSEIITSMGLDVIVQPSEWPPYARLVKKLKKKPFLKVDVIQFDVPIQQLGQPFIVRMDSDKRYSLLNEDNYFILEGEIGVPTELGGIKIHLNAANATAGESFKIAHLPMADAIASLLTSLSIREKGKDTSLIQISCKHQNLYTGMNIVDSIAENYVKMNIQRHAEEATKSIQFLEQQLPTVRKGLQKAEKQLNQYRVDNNSLNLAEESKSLLDQMVSTEQLISQTEVELSGLKLRFTTSHPAVQQLQAKITQWKKEASKLEQRVQSRPKTEQKVLGLMRDQRVKSDIYTFLLNKLQELRVIQAGTVGNARVIDPALMPSKPISPKKKSILLASVLVGFFLGILLVLIRHALRDVVTNPEEVERILGLGMTAVIPHSKRQKQLDRKKSSWKHSKNTDDATKNFLLQAAGDQESTTESLLSLRTNLKVMMAGKENNVVVISGPSASLGKSFISANLCGLMAGHDGMRILLIDADLRRGRLHEYFAVRDASPGLSEAVSEQGPWQSFVRKTNVLGLDVLPSGKTPANPADILMSRQFESILNQASFEYDLVWVDTPPVLVATDAMLVGRHAGLFFLLLRYGINPMGEVKESVRRMYQAGVAVDGIIMNDMKDEHNSYYYGKYYGKYYAYK